MTDQTTSTTQDNFQTFRTDLTRFAVRLDHLWGAEHFRGTWFEDLAKRVRSLQANLRDYPYTTHGIRQYLVELDEAKAFSNFRIEQLRTVSRDGSKLVATAEAQRFLAMHENGNQVVYRHIQDVEFIDQTETGVETRKATVTIEIRIQELWTGKLGWIAVHVDSDDNLDCAAAIEASFAIDEKVGTTTTTYECSPEPVVSEPIQTTATADMHDSLFEASQGADNVAREVMGDIRLKHYADMAEASGRNDVSDYSEAELIEIANNEPGDNERKPNWFQRVFGRG